MLFAERKADDPQIKIFHAVFPWQETELGIHHLSAVAYDQRGMPSEPADVLIAVAAIPSEDIIYPNEEESAPSEVDAEDNAAGDSGQGSGAGTDNGEDEENIQRGGLAVFIPNGGALPADEEQAFEEEMQNIDLADAQFPLDLDGQPNDIAPIISAMTADLTRDGFAATVNISVQAIDDIGLDRITLNITNTDSLDSQSPEHFCMEELSCSMEHTATLGQGQWLITAMAMDTSGQVSREESRIVEVGTPVGNLPPALLEGSLAAGWLNNLGELMVPGPVFEQQGLELDNLLAQIVGNPDVGFEEQEGQQGGGGPGSNEGYSPDRCLSLWGEAVQEGIELNLNIHCSLQAAPGQVLHFSGRAEDMSGSQITSNFLEDFNSSKEIYSEVTVCKQLIHR